MERTINFTELELGAIDILVNSEIFNCKKRLEKNDFSYMSDKISCKNFLKQLEIIHNKINEKENIEEEQEHKLFVEIKYGELLYKTENRGASYGELAYIESLDKEELEEFEEELDKELYKED